MSLPFNQGPPTVPVVLNTSNCFVFGNTASGNALSVQQLGAGNVASFRTTTGATSLFIDQSGNAGFGLTTPIKIIHGYAAAGSNEFRLQSSAVTIGMGINAGNNFGFVYNRTSNPLVFGTNDTERMRITETGNVGIGTASPQTPLHVFSNVGIALSNNSTVAYTGSGTLGYGYGGGVGAGTQFQFRILSQTVNRDNGAGPNFDYGAQGDLVFQRKTNNLYGGGVNDQTYTEVMRIGGATGNVGIGTASPGYLLEVVGSFRTSTTMTFSGGAGGGVRNVTVDNNGTVGYAASDVRLKTDITPLSSGLDKVLQLNPVTFKWKDLNVGGQYTDMGFIAQEVEPIIPEVVRQGQDGWYSLNTQNITAVLTKAIQELSAKNAALEARLAALESRAPPS